MKAHSSSTSQNTDTLNVELLKQNVRKKLKPLLAEALVELVDMLNNDYKTANSKKSNEVRQVLDHIRTFSKQ